MPEVSVLMGAFNCASTIGQSIESIQKQVFSDWELIICDDGSTDETVAVIRKYMLADSRIHLLINDQNKKLAYSLNRCLKEATGKYCARMDGDDLCNPIRFEKQVHFLETHLEYGFVSTVMKRFDEQGVYDEAENRRDYCPVLSDYIKGSPFCHAPVMVRREVYLKVNGYRDIPMTIGVEDYDLWFRLYALGIKGYILGQPLYSMFDGREAAHRRTWKRRLNEFAVRRYGYSLLHVPWVLRIYAVKPILIGLIPEFVYKIIRPFFLKILCF